MTNGSMKIESELLENIGRIHTTPMGITRIKNNLQLSKDDVVEFCRSQILSNDATIERRGKNFYIFVNHIIITVNAYSFTVITAHKDKN